MSQPLLTLWAMSAKARPSNCSTGLKVDIYWHDNPGVEESEHIDAAVRALLAAIRGGVPRRWNPWNLTMIKSEFKNRLILASNGLLKPVDEVGGLGLEDWALFEIKWHGITVENVTESGPAHAEIEVRLIHAEPADSVSVVGLHAHEKVILSSAGETKAAQDAEIQVALTRYWTGYADRWGLVWRS